MNTSAPSIAELKTPNQSLWEFLSQIPASHEAQIFVALLAMGIIGMMANYAVKWARGEIAGNLLNYLFRTNVRGTLLSFFGYISLMLTSIAGHIFTGDQGGFVGWVNVLWFGFTNGFAIDAMANKGQRPVWTEAQRDVAQTSGEPVDKAVLPVTQPQGASNAKTP